jgi:hypothetical protein
MGSRYSAVMIVAAASLVVVACGSVHRPFGEVGVAASASRLDSSPFAPPPASSVFGEAPVVSGVRTQQPSSTAGTCRLPYADISEASGGFITYPGGQRESDPTAQVTLPGGAPGQVGQNPGLTYLASSGRWVPVPRHWVAPNEVFYVYQAGNQIRAVNVVTGSSADMTKNGEWWLIAAANDGAYVSSTSSPGAWFVPISGSPRELVDHGRWERYSGGALWGWDSSNNLIRHEVSTGAESVWGQKQYGSIVGFDASGRPFVIVAMAGTLLLGHSDGSLATLWPGGDSLTAGSPVVEDAHGIWAHIGSGLAGAPGNGIYLWTKSTGFGMVSRHEVIIAGPCL